MRILYIEDDLRAVERIQSALQSRGEAFELEAIASLPEAVERLEGVTAGAAEPDVAAAASAAEAAAAEAASEATTETAAGSIAGAVAGAAAPAIDLALIGPGAASGDLAGMIRRLRAGGRPLPVAVILLQGNGASALKALQAGADEIITDGADLETRLPAGLQLAAARYESKFQAQARQALEPGYRRMVEQAADMIYRYRVEPEPGFEYVSPAASRLTGYTPEQYYANPDLGRALVVPQDIPGKSGHPAGDPAGEYPQAQVVRWKHPDGRVVWIEAHNVIMRETQGKISAIEGIARDVTQRQENEEKLKNQVRRLMGTRHLDPGAGAGLDLDAALRLILQQLQELLQVDAAAFLLLSRSRQVLEVAARQGFRSEALRFTHLALGEGYAGKAALEREMVYIADLPGRLGELNRAPLLEQEGFHTYLAIPLVTGDQVIGVIEVFQRQALNPEAEWLDTLQALGKQAALAVQQARMVEGLQRSHQEISLAFEAALESWANALELREKESQGHNRRLVEMTLKLARRMGIEEAQWTHLRRGALLHDIGKLVIPDAVLNKPGPLDESEWQIMRGHPRAAFAMLQGIPALQPALEIPYSHHERWDGSGYPQGLSGEEIPLSARIFAVVDTWDALLSDRPYRPAWPREWAVSYLKEQAGKAFDPVVVATFLEMVDGDLPDR